MARRIVVILGFGLSLTACQAPGTMEPLPSPPVPRFTGPIEPITEPIVLYLKPFPSSPSLIERTFTAWDRSGQRRAKISQKISSTVEGVRSGSDVVVTTTIDRFEGETANKPAAFEPGTKIRLVYGADGRPRDIASWAPSGDAVRDSVATNLLPNTLRQGIGVLSIFTGYRFDIAKYAFPGLAGQTQQTSGLVRGKAVFGNRDVAVVDFSGTITGGPAPTKLAGFVLYDLDTSLQVYANWRTLTPIQEGEKRAHFGEVTKISLPPSMASVFPDPPARNRRARPRPARRTSGSGIVVSPAGHILTNAHIVNGCGVIQASGGSLVETTGMAVVPKRRSQLAPASGPLSIVSVDRRNDLALLKSAAPVATTAAFRSGRGIRTGESVIVAGFPLPGLLSSDLNVTIGNISALAGPGNDRSLIQITAPVQLGNSGGPVLDASGNVVGVVVARIDALKMAGLTGRMPQNVNFAVSEGTTRAFLDANVVPYRTERSAMELKSVDVAELAKDFTVFIECKIDAR